MGQKVLLFPHVLTSPIGQLLTRAVPSGFPAHRKPSPYWPPFSFLIWAQLLLWSLGQRHFGKHRCQWRPQQLRAPWGHCHSLENRPEPQKELSEGHFWQEQVQVAPFLSSVPLAGTAANLMPDRHSKVCRGGASLGKFTVCPVHAIPSSS